MFNRASDQDGFFGTTSALEKGYEIWNVECLEPLYDRFIEIVREVSGSVS
jgi:hypothetical protein